MKKIYTEKELRAMLKEADQLRRDSKEGHCKIRKEVLDYLVLYEQKFSAELIGLAYFKMADSREGKEKVECLKKSFKYRIRNKSQLDFKLKKAKDNGNSIEEIEELSINLEQSIRDLGYINTVIGINKKNNENLGGAIVSFEEAEGYYKKINDKEGIANVNNSLGKVYEGYSNKVNLTTIEINEALSRAIKCHIKSLDLRKEVYNDYLEQNNFEQANKIMRYISFSNSNICSCYLRIGLYDKALVHCIDDYKVCNKLFVDKDYHRDYCSTLKNIALCISKVGLGRIDEIKTDLENLYFRVMGMEIDFSKIDQDTLVDKILELAQFIANKNEMDSTIVRYIKEINEVKENVRKTNQIEKVKESFKRA